MTAKTALAALATVALVAGGAWSIQTFRHERQQDSAIAACVAKNTNSIAASCWRPILMDAYRTKGLMGMFAMFSDLYARYSAFAGNCHDVMHIIGDTAYDVYERSGEIAAQPEMAYCGYGFYHGFLEKMFVVEGTSDLSKAGAYCEKVRAQQGARSPQIGDGAAAACYHGIGHAVLIASPTDTYGNDSRMSALGVAACDQTSPVAARQVQCDSGVFNALVNAYQDGSYKLSFRKDPASICAEQPPKARLGCYKEVIVQYLNNKNYTFADSVAYIHTVPAAYEPDVLYAYIDNHVRHQLHSPTADNTQAVCDSFTSTGDAQSCLRGAEYALASMGQPHQEYAQMFALCAAYPAADWKREYCMGQAVATLDTMYTPQELARACASTPESRASQVCTQLFK